jgi:hypothetical protein
MDIAEASPQMEDGNQPTVDDLEEIPMIPVKFLLVNIFQKKINRNIMNSFAQTKMYLLGLMKKCPD